MILDRGYVYRVKRIGPKTDPWGTPKVKNEGFEYDSPMLTIWDLSVKYDLNQFMAVPDIPNTVCSL